MWRFLRRVSRKAMRYRHAESNTVFDIPVPSNLYLSTQCTSTRGNVSLVIYTHTKNSLTTDNHYLHFCQGISWKHLCLLPDSLKTLLLCLATKSTFVQFKIIFSFTLTFVLLLVENHCLPQSTSQVIVICSNAFSHPGKCTHGTGQSCSFIPSTIVHFHFERLWLSVL